MSNISSFTKKYAKKDDKYLLDNLMRVSGRSEIFKGPMNVAFTFIFGFITASAVMINVSLGTKIIISIGLVLIALFIKWLFPKRSNKLSDLEEERVFLERILADEKLRNKICK